MRYGSELDEAWRIPRPVKRCLECRLGCNSARQLKPYSKTLDPLNGIQDVNTALMKTSKSLSSCRTTQYISGSGINRDRSMDTGKLCSQMGR
jgi:hypothetical protein